LLLKEELEAPKPPALLFIVSLGACDAFLRSVGAQALRGGLAKNFSKKTSILQFFNSSIFQSSARLCRLACQERSMFNVQCSTFNVQCSMFNVYERLKMGHL